MSLLKHFQKLLLPTFAVVFLLVGAACEKNSHLISSATDPSALAAKSANGIASPFVLGWVELADLPFPDGISGDIPNGLVSPRGFSIKGKGYLCGGMTITRFGEAEELKNLWEFDTATQAWTQKASFPGATPDDGADFVVGSNAYVIVDNANWQYNQPSNTWTEKTSLPADPRAHASAFAIDGKGYIGLGLSLTTGLVDLKDFWQYNPAIDKWHKKTDFPYIKEGAMSFVVNGKGYICSGGRFTNPGTTYFTDLWQYEPGADAWVAKAPFPAVGRSQGIGFNGSVRGFVGTGSNSSAFLGDFWQYTPASNSWLALPNVGGGNRDQAGAFRIGKNLYVAGGTAGLDGKKDFWTLHL